MLKRMIISIALNALTSGAQGPALNRPLTPGDQADAQTFSRTVQGFETQFLEVPEATHDTIVGLALPTVYEFFSKHRRK